MSTAILSFTKTNSGGTDSVWFYGLTADGFSLDDKRTPLLPADKLGPIPAMPLGDTEHAKNNLPDILARWSRRNGTEHTRARTEQSFCVPKTEIVAHGYDFRISNYAQLVYEEILHRQPKMILEELERVEADIQGGLSELKGFPE